MIRNPKTRIGLIVLAVLAVGTVVMLSRTIPVIRETRREMSLTPTPVPEAPDSVLRVTPDPDAPTPEPVLRSGSQGQDVTDLQSRLKTLGYYDGEIDGQFGPGTKDAVILFQKQNGLDADGIVGADTKALLFSAQAKPYTAPAGTTEGGDAP